MTNIIAIVGMAGVGKDTSAEYLSRKNGWEIIHSYTNRPLRPGEKQGREHIFVLHSAPEPEDTFAYTIYGGYEYWTQPDQFKNHRTYIYVIDESGLMDLYENSIMLEACNIIAVNIIADKDLLSSRGVEDGRLGRDDERTTDGIEFDYTIVNDGSLEDLYSELDKITVPDIYKNDARKPINL